MSWRTESCILHELAQVYLQRFLDIEGETPRERLADLLGGDEELIEAAYVGFRRSLDRDDLPSVAEIIDLESNGRMHSIRQPCLVGIDELYASDPDAAMQHDDPVLRKLLAFRLTWDTEKDSAWFAALVKARPVLVAETLVASTLPLLRKGHEHLHGIWQLAHHDDLAAVACAALPELLKGFPLRAKNQLLAPGSPPERPLGAHWVSPAMQTAEDVGAFIDALGGNPSEAAMQELERLLTMSKLEPWHNRLRHAAQTQRIARRKACFQQLEVAEVCRTLADREPANADDLAALADSHLRDLAGKIRDGSTNDYRQYWSFDESNTELLRPKPENDCRDSCCPT